MHKIDVISQVKQLGLHVLHILLSVESPNSLGLAQASSQVLVALLPHFGEGQALKQVETLR